MGFNTLICDSDYWEIIYRQCKLKISIISNLSKCNSVENTQNISLVLFGLNVIWKFNWPDILYLKY